MYVKVDSYMLSLIVYRYNGVKENSMYTDEEYIIAKKIVLEWESQYNRPVETVQLEPIKDETLARFKELEGRRGYRTGLIQDINYYKEDLEKCKKRIDWQ